MPSRGIVSHQTVHDQALPHPVGSVLPPKLTITALLKIFPSEAVLQQLPDSSMDILMPCPTFAFVQRLKERGNIGFGFKTRIPGVNGCHVYYPPKFIYLIVFRDDIQSLMTDD